MSLDRLINLIVAIALIEMMVLIGLQVTMAQLLVTIKDWRLMARAALANYVLVPAVAVLLLIAFEADPMVAAGFLVLAVCPGAPFGPPFAGFARADVATAVGLMVILAGSSAFLAPLLLQVLMPWLAGNEAARADPLAMVRALLMIQLLPLLLGLMMRHRLPGLADRLVGPLERVGEILNGGVAVLILASQFQMLAQIRLRGFAGMLMLLAASLAIGWLAGRSGHSGRRTMALTTALRNVGVGLVIVTGSFGGTAAVSAALAYGIIEVFGSLLVAFWWRHSSPVKAEPAASPTSLSERQ
jgi:bile acid:Na+ symporter, BASS family